jgi:predicted DNA-binding transcriptional regulator AlpA
MGTAEVAALLGGVSRQRVLQLAQQAGFPEPIAVLSMGKVWDSDDVRRWAEHRRQGTP